MCFLNSSNMHILLKIFLFFYVHECLCMFMYTTYLADVHCGSLNGGGLHKPHLFSFLVSELFRKN